MKFLSYDSPFGQLMMKLCYSCCLNILWFLCCIPIVTIGASTTALYYTSLKIVRGGGPRLDPHVLPLLPGKFPPVHRPVADPAGRWRAAGQRRIHRVPSPRLLHRRRRRSVDLDPGPGDRRSGGLHHRFAVCLSPGGQRLQHQLGHAEEFIFYRHPLSLLHHSGVCGPFRDVLLRWSASSPR